MKNHCDIGVFIGRMQPLHLGHMAVIDEALKHCSYVFIVLGSANQARSTRNPFTVSDRLSMLGACYGNNPRVRVISVRDSNYNINSWIERVSEGVASEWRLIKSHDGGMFETPKISLFGYDKDNTTSYLKMFPFWDETSVNNLNNLSATHIREKLFGAVVDVSQKTFAENYFEKAKENALMYLNNDATIDMDQRVVAFLRQFVETPDYHDIVMEYAFAFKYKEIWKNAPYQPTFVTVDACVVMSGHVLLVKRKHYPGKGLWAMPGGFLEPYDSILDSCIRELKEETGIKIPEAVLRGHVTKTQVFDNPYRSSRGRTITHAHLINLGVGELPKVKNQKIDGESETLDVAWVPLHLLKSEDFFEDHYQIIRNLFAQY